MPSTAIVPRCSWRLAPSSLAALVASVPLLGACAAAPEPPATTRSGLTAEACEFFSVDGRVQICHRTSSAQNPYTIIRVNVDGCTRAHVEHAGDYITSTDPSAAHYDPTCSGEGCFPLGAPLDPAHPVPCCEGMDYDDSGHCAISDRCAGVVCAALDACHEAGVCDPATGLCSAPQRLCADENPCTSAACDPATGCVFPPADGSCDDGLYCNGDDWCSDGACTHNGDPCLGGPQCARTCDEAGDHCFDPTGTPCDDGDACTAYDNCVSGACIGSAPIAPGSPLVRLRFDIETYAQEPLLATFSYDDRTRPYSWSPGDYPGGLRSVDLRWRDRAYSAADFQGNDGGVIAIRDRPSSSTDEWVIFLRGSFPNPEADESWPPHLQTVGTRLDLGLYRYGGGALTSNALVPPGFIQGWSGSTVLLEDGRVQVPNPNYDRDDCEMVCGPSLDCEWYPSCVETTGLEVRGTVQSVCYLDESVCGDGVCGGVEDCASCPGDCGACDGACAGKPNLSDCEDGLYCNGADTCNDGICRHAGDPCRGGVECSRSCDEAGDHCAAPLGTACSDDGNACTDEACDGAGACVSTNNAAGCTDRNACTVVDTCVSGVCVGSPPAVPSPGPMVTLRFEGTSYDGRPLVATFSYDKNAQPYSWSPGDYPTALTAIALDFDGAPYGVAEFPSGAISIRNRPSNSTDEWAIFLGGELPDPNAPPDAPPHLRYVHTRFDLGLHGAGTILNSFALVPPAPLSTWRGSIWLIGDERVRVANPEYDVARCEQMCGPSLDCEWVRECQSTTPLEVRGTIDSMCQLDGDLQ